MIDDPKVVDIGLRRIQQRKERGEEPYDDPILKAADEMTELYGETNGSPVKLVVIDYIELIK